MLAILTTRSRLIDFQIDVLSSESNDMMFRAACESIRVRLMNCLRGGELGEISSEIDCDASCRISVTQCDCISTYGSGTSRLTTYSSENESPSARRLCYPPRLQLDNGVMRAMR